LRAQPSGSKGQFAWDREIVIRGIALADAFSAFQANTEKTVSMRVLDSLREAAKPLFAVLFASGIVAVACLTSCSKSAPATPGASYRLSVQVTSEPGRPLPGVPVSYLGQAVGRTDPQGVAGLSIRGSEGEHVALTVSCPDGFHASSKTIDVVLHHWSDAARKPEYEFQCSPLNRTVVVIVRADHGANLPVLYLGREIARTDESGAAHALVSVPASDDTEITLSTSEPGSERLRPQNPSIKFAAADREPLKLFTLKFSLEPEKRRALAAGPRMPVRIN
jgi:hypothetical protein